MKRLVLAPVLLLVATLLGGCVVRAAGPVAIVGPAPIMVAHVHSSGCGHFWGYYSGYPVYHQAGTYSYWDGGTWIRMGAPPVVYQQRRHYHHYQPRGHYYRSAAPYSPARAHQGPPPGAAHQATPAGR